ncbi:MAG: LPS-assembly protein LptD, partial [Arenicellales bacterium]
SDNLQVSSASHIPQTVDLSIDPFDIFVEEENLQINADISAYQTLDSSVSSDEEPYTRLPGINLTWSKGYELNLEDTGGYLRDDSTRFSLLSELGSELVNFTHSKKRKTKGLRLDLQPAISLPMERTYGAITPKLTYAYTAYNVHDQPRKKPSDPTRGIYLFEIGSNLFLEREVSWQAQDHTQTLVPSLSYHYVPYEDQDDLPVFDSGSVGFDNIADAFLGDGFWGSDRIQNFQGFTLGLSSETYELETGDQLLRWELAQQIYLADRDVTLGDDEADSSEFSPFLGEVQFHINEHLSTDGFANWNWDERSIGSWRAGARYSPDFRREFGVSYSWEETINNLELDLTWPLTPQWQIGATALLGQSDDDEDGSYTRVSLGYDACCWAIQLALEDRPSEEEDEEGGLQFMATFSLKGLGRISSNQFEDEFSVTAPNFD